MQNAVPSPKKSPSSLLEKDGRKTVTLPNTEVSQDTDYRFLLLFLFNEQILPKYY